jgi:hypothetical protein
MQHMKAELFFEERFAYRDGAIRAMIIWRIPSSDDERPHSLKYRLFYGYPGKCLVRYDNERGKGDHRHYGDHEESYQWVSVEQLIADFKADIKKLRGLENE